MMRVDMHLHTRYSDGMPLVRAIVAEAARQKISLAITDHNAVGGVREAVMLKKVSILPGIEVTSINRIDVMVYFDRLAVLEAFYEKHIHHNKVHSHVFNMNRVALSVRDIVTKASREGGLVSVAHPYTWGPKRSAEFFESEKKLLKEIDCVEATNGMLASWRNNLGTHFANKHRKGITAGSDAHVLGTVGKVCVVSRASAISEFLEDLRKRRTTVVSKPIPLISHFASEAAMVVNNLRW